MLIFILWPPSPGPICAPPRWDLEATPLLTAILGGSNHVVHLLLRHGITPSLVEMGRVLCTIKGLDEDHLVSVLVDACLYHHFPAINVQDELEAFKNRQRLRP